MSSTLLAFGSKPVRTRSRERTVPLTAMAEGAVGVVVDVRATSEGRADRLLAMGVTPGARVTMLQRFPGIVFLCDQTELAVERAVADAICIRPLEPRS
jgi:DtxR family transcriptional regulator, Mn-dependent transcriptional regulator